MKRVESIDGVVPDRVARPGSETDVADIVGEANAAVEWILPMGGSTAMSGLTPVDRIPVAMDLTGLSGILEYQPADLTVSVRAGTRWVDLERALRAEGQTIPVDVPMPAVATVGGVVATGYAGPRRLRDGTLKDLMLGMAYVRGDGLAAKAGGMVVKNVSGFEIPRLFHGSWGALGVITSVNLKVVPAHEYEMSLAIEPGDTIDLAEQVLRLTVARSAIAAAVADGSLTGESAAMIRLSGREGPTRELARELQANVALPWSTVIDSPDASAAWWQEREDTLAAGEPDLVAIEIGCAPSQVQELLIAVRQTLDGVEPVSIHMTPGVGSIRIAFSSGALSLASWLSLWDQYGLDRIGRFVISQAPVAWRADGSVWRIAPGALSVMQSLKSTFDPKDVLNRGRLWNEPVVRSR